MKDTLARSLRGIWNSISIRSTKRVFLNNRRSEVDQNRNDVEFRFLKIEIGDLVPTVW